MENLQVTWETLLAIAGGVIIFLNAWKGIVHLLDPFKELEEKQKEQEQFLKNDKERLDKLEGEIQNIHKALSVVGLALGELINHELTGNDNDALKKRQDDLNAFFYNNEKY